MNRLPKARTENLVEQNLGRETLIYDLMLHKAFNLNETSSVVYKACDGQTTFEDLKKQHKFSDDFIYLALDELRRNKLLNGAYNSPFAKTSRREIIKRIGLTSIAALPLIVGLTAPQAVHAQSAEQTSCRAFLDECTCSVTRPDNGDEFFVACSDLGGTSDCGNAAGCECNVAPISNTGFCIQFL